MRLDRPNPFCPFRWFTSLGTHRIWPTCVTGRRCPRLSSWTCARPCPSSLGHGLRCTMLTRLALARAKRSHIAQRPSAASQSGSLSNRQCKSWTEIVDPSPKSLRAQECATKRASFIRRSLIVRPRDSHRAASQAPSASHANPTRPRGAVTLHVNGTMGRHH